MKNGLSALPLGGFGEIGMNLMVYECDNEMIIVDVGITFPDEFTPGVDVILPDIKYVRDNIKRLKGIIITHAHEDHIGGVAYLWEDMPVPVYVTKFSNMSLQSKLHEAGLAKEVPVHEVKSGQTVKIGTKFDVEFIGITHSIPESQALAIKTAHGTIIHTGDYKFDPNPSIGNKSNKERLKEIGDAGVLAMFGDSTNIFQTGNSGSEEEVFESLDELLTDRKNRIYICMVSSNVSRMKTAIELAIKHGRKVAIWGLSLKKMLKSAHKCGYIADELYSNIIDPIEAMSLPRNEVLLMVTGAQAESRAALNKIASGEIPLKLTPGDTVLLSARKIPGNERAIYHLINKLTKIGAEVLHGNEDFLVHVSGHGGRDETKEMYDLVRPQIAVPSLGEYSHMSAHLDLIKEIGVPNHFLIENGTRIYLGPDAPYVKVEDTTVGRLYVDGLNILDEDKFIIRERRHMSEQGLVVVSIGIDRQEGTISSDPIVKCCGIIDVELQADLVKDSVDIAKSAALETIAKKGIDIPKIEEAMRIAVRRQFRIERGRKPVTIATAIEC